MKHGGFLVVVLVALVALVVPAASRAQGLGDAAAREREKRKEQAAPTPARTFTDSDLSKEKPSADAAQGADKKDATKADAAKADSVKADDSANADLDREREERKLQEAEWRVRFANAREQVAVAEAACWHEVIRTEFYQGIPVQMKVKEFEESEEFRQAKQALANLEEQFRRTGLPPGWARE
jgi:cytoskeletal protein RodZ